VSTEAQSSTSSTDDPVDDMHHMYCCDQEKSLCGTDLSGAPDLGHVAWDRLCPMCEVLSRLPCAWCGDI
jgi:hypothetical protein